MSRDTFYRYKAAVEEGGVEALFERTRRKPNLANRVGEATEQAVIKSALEFPAYGQARTSNELRKQGDEVAPGELVCGAALASGTEFGLEMVDQVDDVVAPATGTLSDAGARDGDGEMGLAGAGAAD